MVGQVCQYDRDLPVEVEKSRGHEVVAAGRADDPPSATLDEA
jgi:hypothetical protein